MQRPCFLLSILLLTLFLAGCTPSAQVESLEDYQMPTGVPSASELTATVEVEIADRIPPSDCFVTTPQNVSFKAPEPFSPNAPWEGSFWFGSEGLWTALHTDGVWAELPKTSNGHTQKIMWWSDFFVLKDELEPALTVTGQRLDARSEPLRFYGATNAMADDIGEAMLTGVEFPTLGCWEVRGEYKKSSLTFVVWVAP